MDSFIQIVVSGLSLFIGMKVIKGFLKFICFIVAVVFLVMFLISSGLLVM